MCPGCKQEDNVEAMAHLEGFKCLPTNIFVGKGVDDNHTKYHDMPRDTGSLGVVDLHCFFRPQLVDLDQEEAESVSIDFS